MAMQQFRYDPYLQDEAWQFSEKHYVSMVWVTLLMMVLYTPRSVKQKQANYTLWNLADEETLKKLATWFSKIIWFINEKPNILLYYSSVEMIIFAYFVHQICPTLAGYNNVLQQVWPFCRYPWNHYWEFRVYALCRRCVPQLVGLAAQLFLSIPLTLSRTQGVAPRSPVRAMKLPWLYCEGT